MRNILIITGTRAEYGLLQSTIAGIQKSKKLKLSVLVTGMHTLKKFGRTINEIKKDGVSISAVVPVKENDSMVTALSKEITGIEKYCNQHRPDIILVLGDRDEAFAGAIVGSHLGIPVAHIHGGDFTGTIVDGLIRNAITKLAHIHLTASKQSYKRVQNMQENPKNIFLVGAPGLDLLESAPLQTRSVLAKELQLHPDRPWVLFLMHPAVFDKTPLKDQIYNSLKALSQLKEHEKIIIYPNSDTGSEIFVAEINKYQKDSSCHVFPSLSRNQYLSLLDTVEFLIGNSSSGMIESTFFNLPTINIGGRQEHRERGQNVIDVGYEMKNISNAIVLARSVEFKKRLKKVSSPYGDGQAGKKIVKILETIELQDIVRNKTYL